MNNEKHAFDGRCIMANVPASFSRMKTKIRIKDLILSYKCLKWRVLLKYVPFEEAMKARKEGKDIRFIKGNQTVYISASSNMNLKQGWMASLH